MKYRATWQRQDSMEIEADSAAQAKAKLDYFLRRQYSLTVREYQDRIKVLSVIQIEPPLPSEPEDSPPSRGPSGRPSGGGSPGTPTIAARSYTEACAA